MPAHLANLLLLSGALAVPTQDAAPRTAAPTQPAAAAAPAAAFRWTDPDGKPLPFRSEDELLVFLQTADVKSEKALSGGVTFPTKMLLEKDGVRADAVFRDVNEEKTGVSLGGGASDLYFKDSYIYEPAAYELSRLLGLDNVPPATLRRLHNKNGSIQIWVENSMTELKRFHDKLQPPDAVRWNKQYQIINVFDALVYNTDRNRGNILITPDWKLWMIDHTRAFRRVAALQNTGAVRQCERGMYERLKSLDETVARERLKPFLTTFELDSLLKRRKLLVQHLEKLIAENGEAKILYVYREEAAPPQPPNPQ